MGSPPGSKPQPAIGVLLGAAVLLVAVGAWVVMSDACSTKSRQTPVSIAPVTAAPAPQMAPLRPDPPIGAAHFVGWVREHRKAPHKIPNTEPECEPSGACSIGIEDELSGWFNANYFKSNPGAVRFSYHDRGDVSCVDVGAAPLMSWSERPGIVGAAGERCEFRDGELTGLQALIEKNKDEHGRSTGVHFYSKSYAQLDRDFAAGVAADEARAR